MSKEQKKELYKKYTMVSKNKKNGGENSKSKKKPKKKTPQDLEKEQQLKEEFLLDL